MRICTLIRIDFSEGFRSIWRQALLIPGALILQFSYLLVGYTGAGFSLTELAWGDMLAVSFSGMSIYHPERNYPFVIPASWLMVCFILFFIPLRYPFRNLEGFGIQTVVASGGRRSWWISKCLWISAYVLAFWICIFGLSAAVTAICSGDLSLTIGQDVVGSLMIDVIDFVSTPRSLSILSALGAGVCMSWALCMVQFALRFGFGRF
ncbi:hypothetical protein K6V98_03955 [Collinsella sp. AGMB00827]|uniref:ABC transporter permease n=1 Tax=Collinsella ureilytica TaxID=2869515 RepID=A0ABS7MKA5_9ACTN|nr:hypothetical protein [Collinsella urealyticum]MBY4797511.1 hypothetical protein [Collinsella urealyticum]